MNSTERRALAGLASLYVFRMLGLFMVLPVLSVYGADYRGSTPALLGLALGAYGLSQALLQIPLGMLSDHWGRKPVIYTGLAVFALGSLLAAQTDSVYGLVAGRMLQGAGAIAAATMALVADLTRDESRGVAMAVIGAAIGLAFMLAAVLGPVLAGFGGLSAVFWLTAVLALLGILLLWRLVPTPQSPRRPAVYRGGFRRVLGCAEVRRLAAGAFFLHLLLTALFVPLPLVLVDTLRLPGSEHWKIYGPVMLGAFVVMLPLMRAAERSGRARAAMMCAQLALAAGSVALWAVSELSLVFLLAVFFVAFNLLEALMPAQLTRAAPAEARGAATGLYATVQFLGAFSGGSLGGWLYGLGGAGAVAQLGIAVVLMWAALWWRMDARAPKAA
ncbi:MFS transporter [Microbulbifer rhizosphaerae]|uniref:MFS family permease n=1 Tax=Microbulbifer rhizosphaerae TaxID=1562603 RepID=A0A7W4ZC77_9GAMM|nr:MFS transporter [Microbulbifer rhizosphaerae]MBB3063055.1 MFS family permease [Microbulbifer rhizosphaerae]